ncbi:unnamed protein product [Choristocarpus tenellus]
MGMMRAFLGGGIPLVNSGGQPFSIPQAPAPLTAILFAARWCPDCTSFIPRLVEASKEGMARKAEIVFVSSDRSKEDMYGYMRDCLEDWPAVTFDGTHRAKLKRKLGTCAGAEMAELEMDRSSRKYGIPTIAVFRTSDGALITMDGVRDVEEAGSRAFELWEAAAANIGTTHE